MQTRAIPATRNEDAGTRARRVRTPASASTPTAAHNATNGSSTTVTREKTGVRNAPPMVAEAKCSPDSASNVSFSGCRMPDHIPAAQPAAASAHTSMPSESSRKPGNRSIPDGRVTP
jgi:hypothetical protein